MKTGKSSLGHQSKNGRAIFGQYGIGAASSLAGLSIRRRFGFGEERLISPAGLSAVVPFDACLAVVAPLCEGHLRGLSNPDIVASHLGGGICEIIGRMDYPMRWATKPSSRPVRADENHP